MFVNREQELAALERWWETPGAGLSVVWGRRRVGKSWLLRHWADGKRAVVHVARNQPAGAELAALAAGLAAVAPTARRDLLARPFHDWDDAFDVLAEAAAGERLLVIVDEFPELLKASPGLESALRAIWERVDGTCQLKVVLCGSAVRAMEAVQQQDAPLFNRMTLRLQVHPFRVQEIGRMLPAASPLERAAAWGVCGGMPFYLAAWDDDQPFRANVQRLFCNDHALLLGEGEFVLATEDIAGGGRERLPEQVLRAVAGGSTSFTAVRSAVRALPTRVLSDLEGLRLLRRVQPVTERPSTKLSYYRIADNFLAFWLTVIERYRPAIEQGLGRQVLDVVLAEFDDFMGARWEDALRDHVRALAADGRLPGGIVDVGEVWRRQTGPQEDPCQLDLVAVAGRRREVAVLGEAKWAKRRSAGQLIADVRRKATEASLQLAPEPVYVACARDVLTNVPAGTLTVTAHDIFG
jgi:AAA+ ATPase superfamily predicted ATPase